MMLSACRYEGLARDMIIRFKYHRETVFKSFLASLIFSRIEKEGISPEILTYVPLHWTRMVRRGYNQSALIARELSRFMSLDVSAGALRKRRKTLSQAGLPRGKRARNLGDVFAASGVAGRSVMVVDDVITTGQTARAVSRALKDAGARHVCFVSVGRTIA
jgi:ComF family protein